LESGENTWVGPSLFSFSRIGQVQQAKERFMKDKVVLVTGANGGLGKYVTESLLEAGATVAGVSRKIQQSDFSSAAFSAFPGDLSSSEAAKNVVESVVKRLGRLDAVVHTVGGFAGGKSIAETDDATLERMFDLNLKNAFFLMRASIPELRKSGGGRFIAIASRAAVEPGPGVGAYGASKAALISLVKTAAAENKDAGMTANAILPGTMDTPANRQSDPNADFSKCVQPSNVASLVLWLAGNSGKDTNGAVIPIYGDI
jgi:NAD(P)-dependent dehydrogenase (short-subunit alcohol dehydrogenase family)